MKLKNESIKKFKKPELTYQTRNLVHETKIHL
jgi:hypothetical protein